MNTITRVNLANNTVDKIAIFDSEITRWFEENGYNVERDLIKINSTVPSKNFDLEADRIAAELVHYTNVGYDLNGVTYVPVFAAASDVRKATSTWINKEVAPAFWRWAMCGLSIADITGKIAINKYMAYIGLLASASHRFEEAFGKKVDIRRVVVVKDALVNVTGLMDFVNNSGVVDHNVERTIEINAFDGFGIIRKELTNGESCSLRPGPWGKAFVQAVDFRAISAFAFANGKKPEVVDYWGRTVALKDVDIILSESCFKAAKLYHNWEQYCDAFEKLGHNVCACVREHAPKMKGMPYQQGQTLMGDDDDVELFAQHAFDTVSKYQNSNEAVNLLSQYHKAVAKVYPALMKEGHTARTIQEKYESKKQDMLGGRVPELGYNAFIAPDMMAFIQHILGMDITGSLKAGECSCNNCKPGIVDVTRNPHLDNAHVLLNNVDDMKFIDKKTPTMFINIWDLTTIKLRCDYDGDHVWYSQNTDLIDLVNCTYSKLENLPVDWDAPSAPKGVINKAAIANYISGLLKGSEIGLYADALTKMWNNGFDRDVSAWLTYAGNVLIDAAKHGNIKVEKPEAVKEVDGLSLPNFCRFAKADKEHPADSKYWTKERITKKGNVLPPRTAYTGSFLDRYSHRVDELVPDVLNIKGLDDLIFDSHVMLIKPDRKIGKLAGLSKKSRDYNKETGCYEDGGLFQQIAFRHADEWKNIVKQDGFAMNHLEWEEAKKNEAIREMIDWARAQYNGAEGVSDDRILDAVYDIVCRNIFNTKMSDGLDTVVKNAFWRIFGEKCYKVVCENIGEATMEMDFDDDDFDLE